MKGGTMASRESSVASTPLELAIRPYLDEFYVSLLATYGAHLHEQIVLMELSELIQDLLVEGGPEDLMERCFDALEELCVMPGADPFLLEELVFGPLSPPLVELARAYAGPAIEDMIKERRGEGEDQS
ncbi:MAG: hypothetical protein ACRDZP_04195 [Acidimicrobiales bacterium]